MRLSRSLSGLSLAVLGASLSLGAMADAKRDEAQAKKPEQKQAQGATKAGADRLMVVRDPVTGELRAPTADEVRSLQGAPSQALTVPGATVGQPSLRSNTGAMRGARMTDETMSYSVVVRQPGGALEQQCVQGKAGLEAALKPAFTKRRAFNALETE